MIARKWFEITTRIGCINNCVYCPQKKLLNTYFQQDKERCSILTLDDFKIILKKLPSYLEIHFSGMAEPFMNPDAVKMLLHAAEDGRKIAVYTTLRGLSIDELKFLKDIPFVEFIVHVPDNENLMQFEITDEYLEKINFIQENSFCNLAFMCIGTPHPNAVKHVHESIRATVPYTRADNVEINQCGDLKFSDSPKSKVPIICNRRFLFPRFETSLALTENMVILPDGSVLLCCMDYGMQHVLGNLFTESYKDILYSTKRKEISKINWGLKKGCTICQNCTEVINTHHWRFLMYACTGFYYTPIYPAIKKMLGIKS